MIPNIPGHRVIRPIGSGSMGMVYLAEQESLGRQVALKVLYPHHARNRERRERFFNEARLMANLIHPNIVQLFSLVEADGEIVIVMEYVHGRNMDTIIGSEVGPITHEKALPLISDMLKGLGYAHSSGIVHRDIKPGNVLVSADHVAKVTDFGVAKLIGRKGLTKAGAQVGTLAYMSPEQVLGKDVDQRSDIYSLGVTLYEMLAGRLPFDGHETSDMEFMSMILNDRMPDPRDYYPHIPEWLVAIVFKAIEKKPERRFASCEEFMGQIEMGLSIGSVSISMKKPLLRRFSSGVRNLLAGGKTELPTHTGHVSSSGGFGSRGSSSDRYLGETAEEREERKRKQLLELIDKGNRRALDDEGELKVESGITSEEVISPDIKDESFEEFSDGATIHSPDKLSADSEQMLEESIDPIDSKNELLSLKRFFTSTFSKVAGIIVAIGAALYFGVGLPSSGAEDIEAVPVEINPFSPSLRSIAVLDCDSVLSGQLYDVAVSSSGSVAFACSTIISVVSGADGEWISSEVLQANMDICFLPDGRISYSDFNNDDKKVVILDNSLSQTDSITFDCYAPFHRRWYSDSLLCGVTPDIIPDTSAVYLVARFNSSRTMDCVYHSQNYDLTAYRDSIPKYIQHQIVTQYPITAFTDAKNVYVYDTKENNYAIRIYASNGDELATISRDVNQIPMTQLEIDIRRESYQEMMGEAPPDWWPSEMYKPCIEWLGVDHHDRLWVLRGNTPETQFDLYDSQGDLIGEVTTDLPQDGVPWSFEMNGSLILAYRSVDGSIEACFMELVDRERAFELVTAFLAGELSI